MEGKTALGASSPAKPAFTRPEPLSHTRAVVSSSSHMLASGEEEGEEQKEFRSLNQIHSVIYDVCDRNYIQSRAFLFLVRSSRCPETKTY